MSFTARAVAFAKLWLFSFVVGVGLLGAGHASAEAPFSRIVVFGDSLSDAGNLFALGVPAVEAPTYGMDGVVELVLGTNTVHIPEAVFLIPEGPYTSRRFSNGPTWIELLGTALGLGSSVKPALSTEGSNYAFGGATAAGTRPIDLTAQVDRFLSDVGNRAPSDALYVVAIGGNDIRAAMLAAEPSAVIGAALHSVATNIANLYAHGARNFLVWNVPDLGRTPAIRRFDAVACPAIPAPAGCIVQGATQATFGYNFLLTTGTPTLPGVLPALRAGLTDIQITLFDTAGALESVQAHPRRFGLLNASDACIQPDVPLLGFDTKPPFRCAQQDRFFFWDGIHPTRAGHAIIAFLVGKALVEALQEH